MKKQQQHPKRVSDMEGGTLNDDTDPLYDKAVEIVLKDGETSVSYLQRRLGLGFNRTVQLVEAMEKAGILKGRDTVRG